jgi:hypothetical protein
MNLKEAYMVYWNVKLNFGGTEQKCETSCKISFFFFIFFLFFFRKIPISSICVSSLRVSYMNELFGKITPPLFYLGQSGYLLLQFQFSFASSLVLRLIPL